MKNHHTSCKCFIDIMPNTDEVANAMQQTFTNIRPSMSNYINASEKDNMQQIQCGICELLLEVTKDELINNTLLWGNGIVNNQHVWICPDCFETKYGYRPFKNK